MKYFRRMWISESLENERTRLYRQFRAGRPDKTVYLIAVSESPGHMLDIYSGKTLRQRYFRKSGQLVVGAAGTKDEALELAGSIVARAYHETGSADVRSYLLNSLGKGA